KENETGLLFESENHEELAEKMLILLDNPVLRQQMGEAGYQRAKEHFSPERYTELYHKFIERIDGKSVSDSEA
ncbi:MAG: glycosyltransferase, partial [bacterium]